MKDAFGNKYFARGARVQDELGNVGTVLFKVNSFSNTGYRIAWDAPRFGMDVSVCGPKVLSLVTS